MLDKFSAPGVTADQVRVQCDRILASKGFSRSQRQCRFLKYVVDAALEGETDRLKEFTLGIEVFDKDETFDPGIDSIVRVEASRLRSKLSEYYVGEGREDSLRIDIPKGHYAPVFQPIAEPVTTSHPAPKGQMLTGLLAITLIVVVVYSMYRNPQNESAPVVEHQPPPSPSSVAVLPLRDWSRVPEEYFSEAMTDALISSLAETQTLRVTSLTSVMQFQDTEVPIPEIGRILGVAYILEGSVFRDTERARITAQLIDTDTDKHLWSQTYDRPVSDLLSVQTEVAAAVAMQISNKLQPSTKPIPRDINPAAYESFLQGRYFYNQFSSNGFQRGIKSFQDAINIEPDYAEAYAGLASCHCLLAGNGLEIVSPVIAIPEARKFAAKALNLNQDLAEPNAFLGIISFKYEWDLEKSEALLKRSIELNPSFFMAHIWYSEILEATDRHDEAINLARVAKQLNPLSLAANLNLGWQLLQAGNLSEAEAEITKLIEFSPDFWGGHWAMGHIHNQHKSYDNAISEFKLASKLGGHSLPLAALGYTYAVADKPEEAQRIISELETLSREVYVSPFHVAIIYAGLDQPDLMFEWLDRAYQVRARSLAWMQVKSELKPFHKDPRFQDLLNRIGIHSS